MIDYIFRFTALSINRNGNASGSSSLKRKAYERSQFWFITRSVAKTGDIVLDNRQEVNEAYNKHEMIHVERMDPNENTAEDIFEKRLRNGLGQIPATKVVQSKVQ